VLNVGDEIKAKCVEYDSAEGKTRMSLKQMQERPEGFVDRPSGPPRRSGPPHSGGRPPRR